MLLRVAARLRRGGRVGVVRGALGMVTYDSRVVFRQQRRSCNARSGRSCAEAGATTSQTAAQSRSAWRKLRRQEAVFDGEGGGRLSVDGRGRDGLNPP